jgi:HK97 gp10 family phage protein
VKQLSARLRALAVALAPLDVPGIAQAAMQAAAGRMREEIERRLSQPPGGPHEAPWMVTGALRDSIAVSLDGDVVRVGSTDPVAVYQECGTQHLPPRPFLGPVAAAEGEAAAQSTGAAVRDAIKEAVK